MSFIQSLHSHWKSRHPFNKRPQRNYEDTDNERLLADTWEEASSHSIFSVFWKLWIHPSAEECPDDSDLKAENRMEMIN